MIYIYIYTHIYKIYYLQRFWDIVYAYDNDRKNKQRWKNGWISCQSLYPRKHECESFHTSKAIYMIVCMMSWVLLNQIRYITLPTVENEKDVANRCASTEKFFSLDSTWCIYNATKRLRCSLILWKARKIASSKYLHSIIISWRAKFSH